MIEQSSSKALWTKRCTLFVIMTVAMTTACTPTPTPDDTGPVIQAREGTPVAARAITPAASQPRPSGGSPTAISSPFAAGGATVNPTPTDVSAVAAPPGATSTPTPNAPPGATRTPLPTANQTLPATLPPRSNPTASPTTAPNQPTATRTNTPTVIPTPVMGNGWRLHQFNLVTDEYGDLHLFGLVENLTGQTQDSPVVYASFRDALGQEVASDSVSADIEVVPAGWRVPFHLIAFVDAYQTIELSVDSLPSSETIRTDLEVSNVQVTVEDGDYVIRGEIINAGDPLTYLAEIAVALFDSTGKTIGVGWNLVFDTEFDSNGKAPFSVDVGEYFGTASDNYIVTVGY